MYMLMFQSFVMVKKKKKIGCFSSLHELYNQIHEELSGIMVVL